MTSLPKVNVTRLEAHQGWLITCSACPHRATRSTRTDADAHASYHRSTHAQPDPRDEVA